MAVHFWYPCSSPNFELTVNSGFSKCYYLQRTGIMADHADWKALPIELLKLIAERFEYLNDFMRFSATCKSWNSATSDLQHKKPWLPCKHPWLLLAEDTGLDLSAVKVSPLSAVQEPFDYSGYFASRDDQTRAVDRIIDTSITDLYKNISSTRGLFSLATQKIYYLDLPEATDKLIIGTNKGWLLTLGKDLEINLLHPLLREQIPLPPMLTLPIHNEEYDDDYPPQDLCDRFISKVVMSSEVPTKSALQNQDTSHLPMIMTIYSFGLLAVARLGDKLWTNVDPSDYYQFEDIIYHREKFYAITFRGEVYMCDIDNDHPKGTMITSIPFEKKDWVPCYLIESLSGSHFWVVLRIRKRAGDEPVPGELEYYTSNFLVYKLEVHYCDSNVAITTCTWTEVKELGNEALFIGTAASVSIASSEYIKPNSIYFTDDNGETFRFIEAGGHDMGIFNVETGRIQPHFPGISLHPFSPPQWIYLNN